MTREVTLKLLRNLPAWRARAIERIELSSALWLTRSRDIHVRPLSQVAHNPDGSIGHVPDLQADLAELRRTERDGRVELILPIAEFPKAPLLDLHISVAGERVYRVSLEEGAILQAELIKRLSIAAGIENVDFDSGMLNLLAATFFLTRSRYIELWHDYNGVSLSPHRLKCQLSKRVKQRDPLQIYLKESLDIELGSKTYSDWKTILENVGEVVRDRTKPYHFSGSENPLLALPHLCREMMHAGQPPNEERCTEYLRELSRLISQATQKTRSPNPREVAAAKKLLSIYAAGGHRWMAFARCRIPLDDPFIISTGDARLINFKFKRSGDYTTARPTTVIGGHIGKTTWIMVRFNDAETNHLSIRATDTAVRLTPDCKAMDEQAKSLRLDKVDEERSTSELYLRHDSDTERSERISIKTNLRLTRLVSCFLYLAMAVTAFGEYLLISRGIEPKDSQTHGLTAKDAAVILIPVAFVASFVLIRDTSTLAMRLKRFRQAILMIELFVLLGTAFSLYVARHIFAAA